MLRPTNAGASLLRGEGDVQRYREIKPPSSKKRSRTGVKDSFTAPVDADLFDVPREVRTRLGVRARLVALHEVYGVGAKKAADFGAAFLDAIRTFRRPE